MDAVEENQTHEEIRLKSLQQNVAGIHSWRRLGRLVQHGFVIPDNDDDIDDGNNCSWCQSVSLDQKILKLVMYFYLRLTR